MKKNYSAIIFSIAFLLILIRRWAYIQCIDRVFYIIAIIGFFILAIGLNYNKIQKNSWIDMVSKIRQARYGKQDMRWKTRNERKEMKDKKWKIRNDRQRTKDKEWKTRNDRSVLT